MNIDRAENQLTPTVESDASSALRECAYKFDFSESKSAGVRPLNVEKESDRIADNFNRGNNAEKVTAGVNRLSTDLKQLSGDMHKYNQLLKAVADKGSDEPVSNPVLDFQNFNNKTNTYDNVTVYTYHFDYGHKPAFRIVAPGNTLSQIAREMVGDFSDGGSKAVSAQDYMSYLQRINNIENPDKISVGQAIKLREDIFNKTC